jgi:hypothetical protein
VINLNEKKILKSPIIALEMHCFSAKLIPWIISQFGVFVGGNLDFNYEFYHFIRLNDWNLSKLGGLWDRSSAISTIKLSLDGDYSTIIKLRFTWLDND